MFIKQVRFLILVTAVAKEKKTVQTSNKRVSFANMIVVAVLAALIVIAYFFVVTSFFQGWQNAKFFDDAPDMVFLVVSLTFLYYAIKFECSPSKKWLVIGVSLVALAKLIEIPLQEAQAITPLGSLELVLWMPPIIALGLGFLFMAQYLGERVR